MFINVQWVRLDVQRMLSGWDYSEIAVWSMTAWVRLGVHRWLSGWDWVITDG